MKRKIALLISIIMLLSFLPPEFLKAAGISGVTFKEVTTERLTQNEQGILQAIPLNTNNQPESDEVNLKWNVPTAGGKFDLIYYTDMANVNKVTTPGTTKITATFDVGFDENNVKQVSYQIKAEKNFNNGRNTEQHESERITVKASSTAEERGVIINEVNGIIIKIWFNLANNEIYYSTTGIRGGNFTEFDLAYNDNDHAYVSVLKDSEDASIEPTHYESNATKFEDSKDEVVFDPESTDLQEIAGTRPGIKVQFKLPKVVNPNTGLFEMVNQEGMYATLGLTPNYEDGSGNKATIKIPLFNRNDIGSKRKVELDGAIGRENTDAKYAYIEDNTITLYLCRYDDITNSNFKSYIIKWSDLKESMFIGGEVRIDGLQSEDKYGNTQSEKIELPEGVTYLKYNLVKTETDDNGDDNIVLEVTPYKYQQLYYWVYKRDSQGEMPKDYPPYKIYPYTYSQENAGKTLIINVKDKGSSTFQIKPSKSQTIGTDLYASQRLVVDSSGMITAPPGATVKEVTNLYVVENIVEGELRESEVGAAGFDMKWTTPSVSALERYLLRSSTKDPDNENGLGYKCDAKLYYEVRISDERADQDGDILCVIEMSLNENGKLLINGKAAETSEAVTLSEAYVGHVETMLVKPPTYGVENTELWLKNIILKDYSKIRSDQYTYQDMQEVNGELVPKNYLNQENYPWANAEDAESSDSNPKNYFGRTAGSYDYTIPSKYYLRVKTVLDPGAERERLQTNVLTQEPYELVIDKVNKDVPIPENIVVEDKKLNELRGADLSISFDNLQLDDYIYYEIDPRKYELTRGEHTEEERKDDPRTYEIYFYQDTYLDENKMTQKRELTDAEVNNLEADKIFEVSFKSDKKEEMTIDLNDPNSPYKGMLEALRQGKVVRIRYETTADKLDQNNRLIISPIKVIFKGLDTNQSYNTRVRTTVQIFDTLQNSSLEKPPATDTMSKLSKVTGITTDTGSQPPTDDENKPPTPENFTAKVDEADTSHKSILNWDDPEFAYKDELTYDIIRVEGEPLTEEQVRQGANLSLDAFKTLVNRSDLKTVHYEDEKITKQDEQGNNYRIYEYTGDTDLVPNTIYYYYLRSNFNEKYSQWLMRSITTSNIDRPVNLKPFTSTINSIDISFEAKVPMGKVPSEYDFEVWIQEDSSSEWVKANITKLKENQDNVTEGYTYFEYRINQLKPNLRYNIKVRMIDKTKGTDQYSLYSDIKFMRTMYDQDTQDKEDKFDAYLKKFDMEMEKLKKKPYWVLDDGIYKYREKYLIPELETTKQYTLLSESNATEGDYYLPASAIEAANNNQVILEAKVGDIQISIRPDTLTTDNETIREAINRLETNYIEDYYIGIRLKLKEYKEKINGEDPVTPKITVELEVVESKLAEWELEEKIMTELINLIDKERTKFIDKLRSRIDREHISNEDLDNLIADSAADIKKSHQKASQKIVDTEASKTNALAALAKGILITVSNLEDTIVAGYYQSGNLWTEATVYPTGDGASIEAVALGNYIFAGQALLINKIPSLAPYQSFINQYGLGSIFNLEDAASVKVPVTKQQIYASVAKVLGARQDADYATFLKNKGIQGLTLLTQDNDSRQDEMIYIVMQAYEVLNNKKVANVRITNKQAVTNIGAFQPVYRDYVYASVELKIIDNLNNQVLPSVKTTQEDYIKVLYRMTQR